MKVLLKQDVKGLGTAGQVKEVKDGYARNFLIPRQMAVPATAGAMKQAEAQLAAGKRKAAEEEQQARTVADRLGAEPLVIQAKVGEKDRLYGSITSADIAEALQKKTGEEIDKRRIELDEPLRTVGSHQVQIKLAPNVVATVTVDVQPES